MAIATVHRVCSRPERFAFAASVRGITRRLAVHHIGGDGEDALRVCRVSIGWVLAYLLHKSGNDAGRDLIYTIIVIAELRCGFVTFVLIIDYQSCLIARDTHFSVLDGAQTVGDYRKSGDPECHSPEDVAVMKRHLQAFIEILVVHVVDTIHRMYVGTGQPLHRGVELGHDVVVVEKLAGHRQCRRSNLITRFLVTASVDRIEQRLREVYPGAEKLHLLAKSHRGDTAGDAVVVTPERPHQIVIFVLQ